MSNTVFLPAIQSTTTGLPATTGVQTSAGSTSITFASDIATLAVSAAALPLPAGASTEATLAAMSAKLPATLGQKAMAASMAVAIASDQSAVPVSAASLPLPTGAATDATLTKLTIAQGAAIGTNTQTMVGGSVTTAAPVYVTGQVSPLSLTTAGAARVDGSGVTQPVSAVSLPLPAGASTDATLAKLTVAQGAALGTNTQALMGGSVTTAAPTYTTGQISPLSLSTTGALRVDGSGVTQPISAASLPLPTGAATDATLAAMSAKLPATLGQKAMAASMAVTIASDQSTVPVSFGAVNTVQQGKGKIVGSALTGIYATVVTTAAITYIIYILNTCNQTILVSLDGGVHDTFELEAGESVTVDLGANGRQLPATTAIQAKHAGVVPTAGTIRVSLVG